MTQYEMKQNLIITLTPVVTKIILEKQIGSMSLGSITTTIEFIVNGVVDKVSI